jgi:hypothetical protein
MECASLLRKTTYVMIAILTSVALFLVTTAAIVKGGGFVKRSVNQSGSAFHPCSPILAPGISSARAKTGFSRRPDLGDGSPFKSFYTSAI